MSSPLSVCTYTPLVPVFLSVSVVHAVILVVFFNYSPQTPYGKSVEKLGAFFLRKVWMHCEAEAGF